MRTSFALLLFAVVAAPAAGQPAKPKVRELPVVEPAEVGMSAEKLAEVDAVVQRLVKAKRLAGATVVVARKGKVCYLKSFGHADLEAGTPMRPDAVHRIYSMSKAITSAAVLQLVDEGKVRLDDPVSKYIPEMANAKVFAPPRRVKPDRAITVKDLLLHTAGYGYGRSGIREVDAGYATLKLGQRGLPLEEFCKRLARAPLAFSPGTAWQYGVSIDVLGRVVEVAGGMPFETFLKKRILGPLDMRDTGFHVPEGDARTRLTAMYNSDGKGKLTVVDPPATSEYLNPPAMQSGGGGLVSTARDYVRFLEMVRQGGELHGVRILSAEAVTLMTTNQLPKEVGWIRFGEPREGVGFGCGFSVRVKDSDWDPDGRLGEFGWGGAASTHYWVSPKDELTVVTLEQTKPYSFLLEFAVKGLVYDAVE